MGAGREPLGAARAALDAALAEAWRAMDLPRPTTTGVCRGCCMDPEIEADFLSHDAAGLPDAYLRDWFFAAHSDELAYEQMGWLLPRIMAGLAEGVDLATAGEEVTLSRLPVSGFPDRWPQDAVRAVRRFCDALLAHRVAGRTVELDALACMLSLGGHPVPRITALLEGLDDRALARLLHANWCEGWNGTIPISAFWEDPGRSAWWGWATSEALSDRMTRAGLAGDDRAAAVSDVIEAHRRG